MRTIEVVNGYFNHFKSIDEFKKCYVYQAVNDYHGANVKILILKSSDKVEDITERITSILE